jgi:MATE family multidrug resistance protein
MTDLPEVRTLAMTYLPWMLLAPIVAVWSFQLDGVFIGTTHTVEMRNGMLIAAGAFWIATEFLVPTLGNHGLWLAFMGFLALRALMLALWLPRVDRSIAPVPQTLL